MWLKIKMNPHYQRWRRRYKRFMKIYEELKSYQKTLLWGMVLSAFFIRNVKQFWFNALEEINGSSRYKIVNSRPSFQVITFDPSICPYRLCGPYTKVVTLNETRALIELTHTDCRDGVHCCAIAHSIPRRNQEIRYPTNGCYPIKSAQKIQPSVYTEILETACYDLCDNRRISNFHPLISQTYRVESKIKFWNRISSWRLKEIVRVIFVTVDNVSRNQAKKFSSKTLWRFKKFGFYDMKEYSMVESKNNFIRILTGLNNTEVIRKCSFGYLDRCPFIWKRFQNFEYITSYLDESSLKDEVNGSSSSFPEFIAQPTDFYVPSTFMQDKMRLSQVDDELFNVFASTSPTDFILEYSKKVYQKFAIYPFLSVIQLNPDMNSLKKLDIKLKLFFKHLKEFQHNTLIIFTSNVDKSSQNERPFLYISIPNSLQMYRHNLLLNQYRLTNMGDVHQTLNEVIMNSCLLLGSTWDECLFASGRNNKTGQVLWNPVK